MTPRRRLGRGLRALVLLVTAVAGLAAFCWPLFVQPAAQASSTTPLLIGAILPFLLAVVLVELTADGGLDAREVAMLGVLAAVGSVVRPLGAGTAGIELVFVVVILGGRVFGAGFGFLLGAITLATSAVLTAGVGPWLPYQMLATGFVGLGAGLLPRARGRLEIAALVAYGGVSAFCFGSLMDLSAWPFYVGTGGALGWLAGAPPIENLRHFGAYELATGMAWNIGRAITNAVCLIVLGVPVLRLLRRVTRHAATRPGEPRFVDVSTNSP